MYWSKQEVNCSIRTWYFASTWKVKKSISWFLKTLNSMIKLTKSIQNLLTKLETRLLSCRLHQCFINFWAEMFKELNSRKLNFPMIDITNERPSPQINNCWRCDFYDQSAYHISTFGISHKLFSVVNEKSLT
jgi:hypothetical protein